MKGSFGIRGSSVESIVTQLTNAIVVASQYINSGKATPQQFAQAKKLYAFAVRAAMRPKPANVSAAVFAKYVMAVARLANSLALMQNTLPNPDVVVVEDGTQQIEVEVDAPVIDQVDIDALLYEPSFLDTVKESIDAHPIQWGMLAAGTIAVGYLVGREVF